MDKLIAELQRLYFLPGQPCRCGGARQAFDAGVLARALGGEAADIELVAADGRVRTLAIALERGADWESAAGLCGGVAADLGLPAPAVSVSGRSGYRIWFSLAEAVPLADAQRFLDGLRRRYLGELAAARLRLLPAGEASCLELVPARDPASGKWSAFIDPGLGAMFSDDAGLEMPPGPNQQAELLAGFAGIKAAEFGHALALLADAAAGPAPAGSAARLSVSGPFDDPRSFLLAVMNDPAASPRDRIRAAKALLPWFDGR